MGFEVGQEVYGREREEKKHTIKLYTIFKVGRGSPKGIVMMFLVELKVFKKSQSRRGA